MILCIETSTNLCSVSLCSSKNILFNKETLDGPNHAIVLGGYVEEALKYARSQEHAIQAIAISEGPGSYTGLRIGSSIAKGVAYGLNIPLIAVPTLHIMALSAIEFCPQINTDDCICPMIDARRMEVYQAIFNSKGSEIEPTSPLIITNESYASILEKQKIWFIGNGVDKCKEVINHPNANWLMTPTPLSKYMRTAAFKLYESQSFADTAYFTPNYLKEFVTTTPKNKIL